MGTRNYEKRIRVYLDLDGVLADFDKALEDKQMKAKDAKHVPGFYRSLDVLPGAIKAVDDIEKLGYDVWILSKCPDNNFTASGEKIEWVTEHFNHLRNKVILTPDKGAVGTENDYLIDDHIKDGWGNAHNFKGIKIQFDGPKQWEDIIKELYDERVERT